MWGGVGGLQGSWARLADGCWREDPKLAEGPALWTLSLRKKWTQCQPGKVLDHSRHMSLLPAVTSSDCYVTLNLPTASSGTLQTRTVKNSRNPVWNQNFRFRIHRQLKVDQASSLALSLSHCHTCLLVGHCLPRSPLAHLTPVAASLSAPSRMLWN